jgi:aryl-alcohol dehydrogenase-like predicted oxidoreductase
MIPLYACSSSTDRATDAPVNGGSSTAHPTPTATGTVPTRRLGRTNIAVSAVGLGGYHLGKASSEAEAQRIVHRAVDQGITFLDNCWDYHAGKSEEWMGRALEGGRRQKVFLMTKTDGHTRQACSLQLDQSLRRLRTDVIDLVQVHEVIRPGDPQAVFAPGGAIEALIEARAAGKIRFIGFTGHKHPDIHLAMLATAEKNGFTFDTVQMPLNVFDAHYESFEQRVLPELLRRDIGVLGMKPLAGGHALEAGAVSAEECLRYALSLPASVVITGCETMERVEQALRVVRESEPLRPEARAELLARSKPHAGDGKLERFKTSNEFDGTIRNPHWLTTADASGKS